jgi:O-acetylhomoserine (thiol)-lyase
LFDQRIDGSLGVQGGYGGVDGAVEGLGIGESLVGEMMRFEVAPYNLDVIEFRPLFGQPFDGEPMGAGGQRRPRRLAHMDRSVVEHDDDGLNPQARLRAIQGVQHLQERNEVGAALGLAGVHDEPAGGVIEAPIIATFLACPGTGTRRSAPRLAQALAR